MRGLAWAAGIWSIVALGAFFLRGRLPAVTQFFNRPNAALMLALLGTFSISGQADADAVLDNPVVLERVVRGGLSALALALATPVLIARFRRRGGPGHKGLAAIVIYGLIALLSTIYSTAPIVTFGKVFELSAGIVAVAAVAYDTKPAEGLRRMLMLTLLAMASLMVAGVVGFFAMPDVFGPFESRPGFVSLRTLSPPYAHSNAMASMAAIIGVFSVARMLDRDSSVWFWRGLSLISFVALILASGRQGVVMYLFGILVVLLVTRRRMLFLALVPAIAALLMAYSQQILDALSRDRPQNLGTLTGRLGYWEAAVRVWSDHPWTGWGYGSGGRFVALESIGQSSISSLHSGYFEALTGVGILGVIPLLYAMFRVARWSWLHLSASSQVAEATLIGLLMLRTGVSLGFAGWLTMELLLFLVLVAWSDAQPFPIPKSTPSRERTGSSIESSRGIPVRPG